MDLTQIEARAIDLLAQIAVAPGMDSNSIISSSYGQDSSWTQDASLARTNMRAIELLTITGLVRLAGGGYGLVATEEGRIAVEQGLKSIPDTDRVRQWAENEAIADALGDRPQPSQVSLNRLVIRDWRQFSDVDITFHPRLTILTGANGSGKTTLLNLLAPHFNWSAQLLTRASQRSTESHEASIGHLEYSNGLRTPLIQNASTGVRNTPVSLPLMQHVPGIFIGSHRSISTYQPLDALPARFSESAVLQQQFSSELQVRYTGGSSQRPPLYRMKEALVAAALHGYGNIAVRPDLEARELWEGYQSVLRRFLPAELRFSRLAIENSDVILVTELTEFPLEAVSGGVSAMLELSWQIYLRQRDSPVFTVCIDEPENHLHPELQRSIIPSLLAGFPGVTFVISTHSPFLVTSTQDSFVYALGRDTEGRVASRRITNLNKSGTPDETLMTVLGLDTALPLWAEERLGELLSTLPASPSVGELRELRDKLRELGLSKQFPAAISSLGGHE